MMKKALSLLLLVNTALFAQTPGGLPTAATYEPSANQAQIINQQLQTLTTQVSQLQGQLNRQLQQMQQQLEQLYTQTTKIQQQIGEIAKLDTWFVTTPPPPRS